MQTVLREDGEVDLDLDNFEGQTCFLSISVEDNGQGIKQESMQKLFSLFGKLKEGAQSCNKNGVGLGLMICKRLSE